MKPRLPLTARLYEDRVRQLESVVDIGLECFSYTPAWRFIKRRTRALRIVDDVLALERARAEYEDCL